MDLTSVNLMQLTPKAVILCEMTHNEGHKDVQGHRFWYKLTLTYNFLLATNFISCFAQFLNCHGILVELRQLTAVPLFGSLVWAESMNSGLQHTASKN